MNLWDATLDWLFAESPFKVCQDWVRHAKRCFDYDRRLGQIGTGTQFRYDGRGNRLSVTRAGSETLYVYDPWGNLLAAWDGTGLRKYIYGRGLIAMQTGSARYCYHFNPTGSTTALTDMSGSIANSYAYDPFGVPARNETVPQPFMFVGRYGVMFEPEDLYYMRARYYDPNVGRFISEDPLGFAGGDVNLYAYVQNDPLNTIDPFGLTAMELVAPIALVISQLDSPAPGPADMIAGALIGAAWIYDTWPKDNSCGTMMGKIGDDDKVRDILKARKGSIKQAQLPEGSPSWDEIQDMAFKDITKNAQHNVTGFKTIRKLLNDSRFYK